MDSCSYVPDSLIRLFVNNCNSLFFLICSAQKAGLLCEVDEHSSDNDQVSYFYST